MSEQLQIDRRGFLALGGVTAGAALLGACDRDSRELSSSESDLDLSTWSGVRDAFDLDPTLIHLAAFVLASHPRPVREAIEGYRRELDRDTITYLNEEEYAKDGDSRLALADYLATQQDEIALTDSTTMGLGLLYGGLTLTPGQEILATEHDFYSTHEALRLRVERSGGAFRKVALFRDATNATTDEIVESVRGEVTERTRVLAITWVHSSTGLKLPVGAIADTVADLNRGRVESDRLLLCVDGVHGFGVEDETLESLGCDFLVSGCHKWLFGPRGTGMVAGRRDAWPTVRPTIPTFEVDNIVAWITDQPRGNLPGALMNTPGGFKPFEHRWALRETVDFHFAIGKARIAERTHALATQLKEGLVQIDGVTLVTPISTELSSGIVCFDVEGRPPPDILEGLKNARGIIASVTPYAEQHIRMGPSIVTSEEDVDETLRVLRSLV